MAAVMPSNGFNFPHSGDASRIAPGRIIDVDDEAGQKPVERVNFLYGRANRCHVWSVAYPDPLINPSTSVITSPYARVKLGSDRDAWTIDAWGEYIELEVILYNTSKVMADPGWTTGALTVGATPALLLGTWSNVNITEGYVQYKIRENPATPASIAKLYYLRILPDILAASDLP